MSYALDIADEAVEDLTQLLDSLPEARRADAEDAIEAVLVAFAALPMRDRAKHRYCPVHFTAGGTRYYWGATYCYTPDETTLVITHLYRTSF